MAPDDTSVLAFLFLPRRYCPQKQQVVFANGESYIVDVVGHFPAEERIGRLNGDVSNLARSRITFQ